jgi:hypothetical protein
MLKSRIVNVAAWQFQGSTHCQVFERGQSLLAPSTGRCNPATPALHPRGGVTTARFFPRSSAPRVMTGNGSCQNCCFWHCRQRRIYNLWKANSRARNESHPHRQQSDRLLRASVGKTRGQPESTNHIAGCVWKNRFQKASLSGVATGIGPKCSPNSITVGDFGSKAGQLGKPGAFGLPVVT